MQHEHRYNIADAAEVAGVPSGTVRSWRSRGADIADPPLDLADCASLRLMAQLVAFCVPVPPAADIARAMRDRWAQVMVDEASSPTLLVRPEGDEFRFALCPRADVPDRLKDLVLVVDLVAVLRHVLIELAGRQKVAE